MLAEERYQRILQLIEQNRIVTVADIVNECRISDITARRDLVHLGRMNKITRIRGGAKAVESKTVPSDLNERFYRQALEHREEKRIIGGFAASLIEDGEIIILDGGSTTLEIAKQLVGKKRSHGDCHRHQYCRRIGIQGRRYHHTDRGDAAFQDQFPGQSLA